jgi:hypothetical protein
MSVFYFYSLPLSTTVYIKKTRTTNKFLSYEVCDIIKFAVNCQQSSHVIWCWPPSAISLEKCVSKCRLGRNLVYRFCHGAEPPTPMRPTRARVFGTKGCIKSGGSKEREVHFYPTINIKLECLFYSS